MRAIVTYLGQLLALLLSMPGTMSISSLFLQKMTGFVSQTSCTRAIHMIYMYPAAPGSKNNQLSKVNL